MSSTKAPAKPAEKKTAIPVSVAKHNEDPTKQPILAANVAPETNPPAQPADTKTKTTDKDGKDVKGVGYTYIGGGEDSPRVINFMGKQKFVRGELTTVTDPEVLAKLDGASTFVKGKADQETLHRIDEDAKAEADLQRAQDKLTDRRFKKTHVGE